MWKITIGKYRYLIVFFIGHDALVQRILRITPVGIETNPTPRQVHGYRMDVGRFGKRIPTLISVPVIILYIAAQYAVGRTPGLDIVIQGGRHRLDGE